MSRKRCSCHSDRSLYGSLIECAKCRHWSFDRIAGSCERRKCGYVQATFSHSETQITLDLR